MTMEKIILEVCRVDELDDSRGRFSRPARAWDPMPLFESTEIRTPTRTRLRLTEWFEGAPFFPAIRRRSEPELLPTQEISRS
jgi:hypothetical protein